jgi:putative membrane protein
MRLSSARLSVALAALPLVALAFRHGDHMGDWGGGWWIAMVVMMVVFWAAVIALVVWAFTRVAGTHKAEKSALDIAKERLARGEISTEEFERIKHQLVLTPAR